MDFEEEWKIFKDEFDDRLAHLKIIDKNVKIPDEDYWW